MPKDTIQFFAETTGLEFSCGCDNFDDMLETALQYANTTTLPTQMRVSITCSEKTQRKYNLGERQFDFIHKL